MRDFYATLAHVFPILLLALMWDSAYLARLRKQQRSPRRVDPAGVRFWTKPRVRVYALFVTGEAIASTAVATMVLAGFIPDSSALRVVLSAGLALLLITLLTRIAVDIVLATAVDTRSVDTMPAAAECAAPADPPADAALSDQPPA